MGKDLVRMREFIARHFSLEELETLCMDLGIDYDELGDGGKTVKTQALLRLLGQRHQLDRLVEALYEERPAEAAQSGIRRDPEGIEQLYLSLPGVTEAERPRDERILLGRVRSFWIEGVLEHAARTTALIDLSKETQAEAVAHAWEQVLQVPGEARQTLPPGEKIDRIFDEMNRSMLILGDPGSGKTTTLLQLARELLTQAEAHAAEPIPVVFNLSTWTSYQKHLASWLVQELTTKYQIPKRIGRMWLDGNRLLPLLDGLDEVGVDDRTACVEAINRFIEEYGMSGIAVCSRTGVYVTLSARLSLGGAVRLLPLTLQQVYDFLDSAGGTLNALRNALNHDPDLQRLAQSPLILGIMSLAYRDTLEAGEALGNSAVTGSERLFDTYVAQMLNRKGTHSRRYSAKDSRLWLSWLAAQMQWHNQSIFLVEQLQPSWLPADASRWLYVLTSRLLLGGLTGVIVGVVVGLVPGLIAGLIGGAWVGFINGQRSLTSLGRVERVQPPMRGEVIRNVALVSVTTCLIVWVITTMLFGQFAAFVLSLALGAVFGVTFGLRPGYTDLAHDIRTVEALSLSLARAITMAVLGFVLGVLAGLLSEVLFRFAFSFPLNAAPTDWLRTGLVFGTVGVICGAVLGGMRSSVVERKVVPNQGIRLSAKNGLLAGSVAGGIIGVLCLFFGDFYGELLAYLSGGLITGLSGGVWGGLTAGICGGMLVSLWYGGIDVDVIQHAILRVILVCQRRMPWRFINFLEYSTELIFLLRVGSGYSFIHRLLLEHFASLNKRTEASKGRPT